MGRFVNATGIAVAVAAAAAVYHVKYEASQAATQVASLQRDIARERDAIAVMRAEWSHLGHPARLQKLAEMYLELRPLEARQIVGVLEVPERLPELEPAEDGDEVASPLPLESLPEVEPDLAPVAEAEPVEDAPVGGIAGILRNIQ